MATVTLRNTKGSALTFTEMDNNFSNLNTDKLENITAENIGDLSDVDTAGVTNTQILIYNSSSGNFEVGDQPGGLSNVVEDTTPQLGGDLDAQSNNITNLGTINTHTVPGGTGTFALTSDITFTEVVDDTTPQLGGNLDAQSNNITSLGTLNTHTIPGGTGTFALTSDITFTDVVDDTTPQLGGDLDLNSNDITGTGDVNITGTVVAQSTLNAQTGTTYTPVIGDASKLVTLNNAAAITLTIPPNSSVAYPVGTKLDLAQIGAGQVTVAQGSGVTVNSTPTLKLRAQYSAATCIKTATDTWLLVGDLAAS